MRRIALIAVVSLALPFAGCGSSSSQQKPPQLDPPQVFLTVPEANVIGTGFDLTVNVDGCQAVESVAVLDHGRAVATLPTPTVPVNVTLKASDLSFSSGLAAQLSLSASATCDDGRTNTSQPQPGTFFPVAQVFHPTSQVPTFFVAEGHAPKVTFVGCILGSHTLVRIDSAGTVLKTAQLPFDCTWSTSITDKNASTGLRWIYTPYSQATSDRPGAAAFDANLTFVAQALDSSGNLLPVQYLGVGPDGDAVVVGPPGAATGQNDWIFRIAHDDCVGVSVCKPPKWSTGQNLTARPQGNPVITSAGVFVPMQTDDNAGTTSFFVYELNYTDSTGVSEPVLFQTQHDTLDPAPQIAMTVSPDGTKTLLPFNTNVAGTFQVDGCATNQSPCSGWAAPPSGSTFQGAALAAAPFGAGDPYVAAVGSQNTYFVRMDTGANVGKGGLPITASGSLQTVAYQPGKAADFYVLNGGPGALPTEIVGIDSPQTGELFRVQIPGGSLSIALDDDGLGWLRVGNDLMQLLPLSQYRMLRGQ